MEDLIWSHDVHSELSISCLLMLCFVPITILIPIFYAPLPASTGLLYQRLVPSFPVMKLHIMIPNAFTGTWKLLLVLCILAYLFLVHAFRHRRLRNLERKHAPAGRESFRHMTADDAQAILKTLAELEFPSLYGLAMVMALFRVGSAHRYLEYSQMTNLVA